MTGIVGIFTTNGTGGNPGMTTVIGIEGSTTGISSGTTGTTIGGKLETVTEIGIVSTGGMTITGGIGGNGGITITGGIVTVGGGTTMGVIGGGAGITITGVAGDGGV